MNAEEKCMHDYFKTLACYHVWSTRKLLDEHVSLLSDEEQFRDCGLFFKSVHGTLNHLLVADHIWYARFAGEPPPYPTLHENPFAATPAGRAELAKALIAQYTRWSTLIASMRTEQFGAPFAYKRVDGTAMQTPFAATLGHIFNHATHHRGQVSAGLTMMGHKAPEIDLGIMLQAEYRAAQHT
jgi:uncharacterized damage-inducible protein DinB